MEELSGIWKWRSRLPNTISPASSAVGKAQCLCLLAPWADAGCCVHRQAFREFSVASKLGTFTSYRNANSWQFSFQLIDFYGSQPWLFFQSRLLLEV